MGISVVIALAAAAAARASESIADAPPGRAHLAAACRRAAPDGQGRPFACRLIPPARMHATFGWRESTTSRVADPMRINAPKHEVRLHLPDLIGFDWRISRRSSIRRGRRRDQYLAGESG